MTISMCEVPAVVSPAVIRPRLLGILDQPPVPPIILIVAPAGYGKTTLAAQWTASRAATAWLTLTNEHNSPGRFLRDLLSSLGMPNALSPTLDTALSVIEETASRTTGSVLVLDDCHVIENQEIHQMLNVLVSTLPKGLHLLLASRAIPPVPLSRRRLNGEVRDISMADLAFTEEEVAALAASGPGPQLNANDISNLTTRTEGWIAGVRLALASAEALNATQEASIIDTWYAQQSLDEFVLEEVLATLPQDVREFLRRTAFLPWFDPGLCDYVLEIDTSAALITEASRRVAFLRPTNVSASRPTYHALFAESVMRIDVRYSSTADRKRRRMRAADWFGRHGHLEAALDQALRAEDWKMAIRHVTSVCREQFIRSLPSSVMYWLRRLPDSVLISDPEISYWYIWALQNTGRLREARQKFDVLNPVWLASGDPVQLGFSLASRRFFASLDGDIEYALRLGYESLTHFPVERAAERLQTWSGIMQNEFLRGHDDLAAAAYAEAQRSRQRLPQDQGWWTLVIELDRANQRALRGELMAAMELYQHSLQTLSSHYRSNAGRIRFRIAAIALEWNDLDEASHQAEAILQDVETYPYHVWHPESMLVVARVHLAKGEWDAAESVLRQVRSMFNEHGGKHNLTRLEATEAELWLHTGREHLVEEWSIRARVDEIASVRIFGDVDPRLILIWSALSCNDVSLANSMLQSVISSSISSKRWAELVPLAMWQVAANLERGEEAGALEALRLALRHGRLGGFVRSFATPGHDLGPFLRQVRPHLQARDAAYVERLLELSSATSSPHKAPDLISGTPASLLTPREVEVLQLLASGLSNQEISDRLFISERTAKKHVSNILRKLDASNRTTAVSRAWELGLIDD